MRRRVGMPLFFVAALALAAGMSAVAAQSAPGQLTISPDSGPPGTAITAKGTGCSPPAEVGTFLFDEGTQRNLDLKQVSPEPGGSWTATLTVPAGFRPTGRVLVGATCGEDEEYRAQVFTVTQQASPPQRTPRSPSFTG